MSPKDITFITSNPAKAEQLEWHIKYPIKHLKVDIPEIQSLNLDEVIQHKAKAAYELVHIPVLVEDFSLVLHALGKLPGTLIKWFLEEIGTAGVCHLLDNTINRAATATVAFGLYDGKNFRLFKDERNGTIARSPRAEQKFATDSIFILDGYGKTWSEMSKDEQLATSIRGAALKQLEKYLHQIEPAKIGKPE